MLSAEHLRLLHWLSLIAAVAAILTGCITLLGWQWEIPLLYSVSSDLPPMTPNSALGFILAGLSLVLLQPDDFSTARRAAGVVLAFAVLALGGMTLMEYAGLLPAYPVERLFMGVFPHDPFVLESSPQTALAFCMLALALWVLGSKQAILIYLVQWLALVGVMLLVVVFLGYAHREDMFYVFSGKVGMSLHTATAFDFIGWGVILARIEQGSFRIMASDTAGGAVVRRVMLLMVIFPVLLGWLPLLLDSKHFTHTQIESLLASTLIFIVVIIVIRLAFHLDRQDELRRLAEEEAREHLGRFAHVSRLNMMGEMASGIAHELNQPLTAINNYTAAVQRLLANAEGKGADVEIPLRNIRTQANRASSIIQRMRDFVRKQQPQTTLVDLNQLLHSVPMLISNQLRESRVQLHWELEENIMVRVDPIQIEQVILNLLCNSLDAVSGNQALQRKITLRSRKITGGWAQVDITDTGPGIEPELLPQIFDAFVTTKGAEGMGIGLPLSLSIIEAHDGRLWVESESGAGATFSFTLPLYKKQV